MKKINTQQGFTQIPILIVLIVFGAVATATGGYYISKHNQKSVAETPKTEVEVVATGTPVVIEEKVEALEEARQEIKNLKNTNQDIQRRQSALEKQVQTKNETKNEEPVQAVSLGISDLTKYLTGVGELRCFNGDNSIEAKNGTSGTGFLMRMNGSEYVIVTNRHVVGDYNSCDFYISPISRRQFDNSVDWLFMRDNVQGRVTTYSGVDFADIRMSEDDFPANGVKHIKALNYLIGDLAVCSEELPIGSTIYTIGYPAYSTQGQTERIILEGQVSGYTGSRSLENKNYFISNRIDSGNSGSPAIAIEEGRFCLAGVVTWLSAGDFENQGVVLNFRNVVD